ncbi:MAG: hypothetical protein K9J09_02060 [Limnohabitans sp.]|jgi:hypothetical protein|nr:hypothetical protein [Limnohabitans sp.]
MLSGNVFAEYKVYECSNERETFSCNAFKCSDYYKKILPKSYINFNINVKEKIIQKNTYLGGLFIKSNTLENCVIVDKKNWACISDTGEKEGMHNDIYYQNTDLTHKCGKLSFIFD